MKTLGRRNAGRRMRGFALAELAVAALLLTLSVIWLAGRWQTRVEDAAAEATAAHLLTVRGAVQELMARHFDHLTGWAEAADATAPPLPEALRPPPPLAFGVEVLRAAVAEGGAGVLPPTFPLVPPLGEGVTVRLARQGDCPGASCRLEAFVHTQAPLRHAGSAGENDHRPDLVGAFMLATGGYGAHAPPTQPDRLRGALLETANPLGPVPGVVAVVASLDATHFQQFVRHGDTRPVRLRNHLAVAGELTTQGGLRLDTAVGVGTACVGEGIYARSAAGTLAQCLAGIWFERERYVVQGWLADLADGAAVPNPDCPAGLQPFVRASLARLDVAVGGEAIDVRGRVEGTLSGAGRSDANGQVSLSGSFSGALASTPESWIRVEQEARVAAGRVSIPQAGADARAQVVYGCVHA